MRWLPGLRVVVTVGVLLGLGHVVMQQATAPQDRLYAFIYQRGPVQYVILGVAAFALVLLYRRQRDYLDNAAQLKRFKGSEGDPPGPLAEALRKVARSHADHGPAAARSQVEQFRDDRSKAVQQDGDIVRLAVGSLPVLGLLGTMLGLSDALYGAFSKGMFGDAEVKAFVSGLSTALDTTVLAMLCAAPLFAWSALLVRQQSRLVDQCADFLREHLGLTDIVEKDKGTYAIYAELCRLTKQIGQDAKAMFAEMLDVSANALRETLGEAVDKHLRQHHQSQLEAVRAADREVAEQVHEAARAMLHVLQTQNRELTERMTHQMGRLESALRNRTPEEVIFRYRDNGALHRGA